MAHHGRCHEGHRVSAVKRITVTMVNDQVYDLRIMPGDVVRTERQYGVSASAFESDPHLEHILYMAWVSSKRNDYTGSFDDWVDTVADIDLSTGDTANPTVPAP